MNRLKQATENITPNGGSQSLSWQQTYTFDRYGNRNFDEANTTTLPKDCTESGNPVVCEAIRPIVNPSVNTADNRLNGYTFDPAGNTTVDAEGRTFIYDAENKQVKVKDAQDQTIGEYSYDGDAKRVKKFVPATGETTIFVYDIEGKMVAEYSTLIEQSPKISYLTHDHLGSPRILTDQFGAVTSRRDFMPYGEEITRTGYGQDSVREKFATYERDGESGLDYAQARYYSSSLGRFFSIDPENAGAFEENPQSWNAYQYSLNNPIVFTDPEGLDVRYCTKDGGCITLSSAEEKSLFDKEYQASIGNTVKNGRVRDANGTVIATYTNNNSIALMLRGAQPTLEIWKPVVDAVTPAGGPGGVLIKGGMWIFKGGKWVYQAVNAGSKVRRALPVLQKLCFVAGTPVLTRSGLKPIEEIREGDEVLSYNEKTKQNEFKTVVQTFERFAEAGRILSVKVEGEAAPLGVTHEHPFYVRIHRARDNTSSEDDDGEWVEAGNLRVGDQIRKADGTWAVVENIVTRSEGAKVYNFEVADNHNYFVGDTSLLAHNNCLPAAGKRRIGNLVKHANELVRDVQKARGGKANAWNAIDTIEDGVDYSKLTLGEVANAAGEGIKAAQRVLKQVKDAKRLANQN